MSSSNSTERWVVVASRDDGDAFDLVVLGTFRRRERAEARAATIQRLADKYDDDATLTIAVEPIRPGGSLSAQAAMDYLYGAIA